MAVHVVALGGSLLRPEESQRHAWLAGIAAVIGDAIRSGEVLGLVIGGGAPAREAIGLAAAVVHDVALLDEIGIAATRLNATMLRSTLVAAGIDVAVGIPHTVEDAASALQRHDAVVMGGTMPGHTTDAVAIRLAIAAGAERCIIATNVDHVYSDDPRLVADAVAHARLSLEELAAIVGPAEHRAAGASSVIDPVGVGAALEASMPLAVLDGRRLDGLAAALASESYVGTIIDP